MTRKNLHCVTKRDGHSLNSWECMEAEARQQEREGATSGGRKRLYSQEISIMYLFIRAFYRVPQKKCPIEIFSLYLFQRSDYTFLHVFRNQSFESFKSL